MSGVRSTNLPSSNAPVELLGHDFIGSQRRLVRVPVGAIGGGSGGGSSGEFVEAVAALASRFDEAQGLFVEPRDRPGDARFFFTSTLAGEARTLPTISFGTVAATEDGTVLRVPGASPAQIVAMRRDFGVEAGQVYAVRYQARRHTNTSDPFGDSVEFRVACLDKDKGYLSTLLIGKRALTVADGAFSAQGTFSLDQSADVTLTPGTLYVRPYVRILGGDGVTDVAIIDAYRTTGLIGPKGDKGDEPEYQIDNTEEMIRWRQADGTLGPWLDIGSARRKAEAARDIAAGYASDAVSQGNVPIYGTIAGMPALSVPVGINAIRVNGRATSGDGDGGLYVDTNNGSSDTFTSAGGRVWYRAVDRVRAPGSGGTLRPLLEVLLDRPPSAAWYGYKGDGVANDTTAINAALAANRAVFIPPRYDGGAARLEGPLVGQIEGEVHGFADGGSILERWGVWNGPTLTFGQDAAGLGSYAAKVKGVCFRQRHPGFAQGTSVTMVDRLNADQAHLKVYGGAGGKVEDCRFDGGVYAIDILGGTSFLIDHCRFVGSWDDVNAAVSETKAYVRIRNSPTHGVATMHKIKDSYLAGGPLVSRSYTIGSTTFTMQREGGAAYGVVIEGGEGIEIAGGYIGGQNRNSLYINPDGTICSDIKMHDVFVDGCLDASIRNEAQVDGALANFIDVHDCSFLGQLSCPAIWVIASRAGQPTASIVSFHNNRGQGHLKTPLMLDGVRGMQVHSNTIAAYNARNSGAAVDFAAGAYVYGASREVDFLGNKWGGGLNNLGDVNNCKWGVVKAADSSTATAALERALLGMAGGSVVSGMSQTYPT